jgi:hypothetical protein
MALNTGSAYAVLLDQPPPAGYSNWTAPLLAQGASFGSVTQLAAHIEVFVNGYNEDAHPFIWTKSVVHQKRLKPSPPRAKVRLRKLDAYCGDDCKPEYLNHYGRAFGLNVGAADATDRPLTLVSLFT